MSTVVALASLRARRPACVHPPSPRPAAEQGNRPETAAQAVRPVARRPAPVGEAAAQRGPRIPQAPVQRPSPTVAPGVRAQPQGARGEACELYRVGPSLGPGQTARGPKARTGAARAGRPVGLRRVPPTARPHDPIRQRGRRAAPPAAVRERTCISPCPAGVAARKDPTPRAGEVVAGTGPWRRGDRPPLCERVRLSASAEVRAAPLDHVCDRRAVVRPGAHHGALSRIDRGQP